MTATTLNPFDAAMTAEEQPQTRITFGEIVTVDSWFCVLQKGPGKVPYDPGYHRPDQRRIAITLEIAPLRGDFTIKREMLAELGKEWTGVTLPSLRALNVDLKTLKGKFCQMEQRETGESYVGKDGETKKKTAMHFLAIYPDRASCQAAADAFFGQRSEPAPAGDQRNTPQPLPADDSTSGAERTTALAALPHLWKAAGQDMVRFEAMLQSNPLISKHFTLASPEVIQVAANIPL